MLFGLLSWIALWIAVWMTLWIALLDCSLDCSRDCSLGLLSGFGLLSWTAFLIALWIALWMALWIALLDCSLVGVFGFASYASSLCLGSCAGVIYNANAGSYPNGAVSDML